MKVTKFRNKDILHLTEEPPVDEVHFAFEDDTEENETSNLPLIESHITTRNLIISMQK